MARRRTEPRWLSRLVVDAIHADQIHQHGGLRTAGGDRPGIDSRPPQQKWAYDEEPDIAVLAAAYAFGLVRNHPYRDGNKRIGFLALVTFLGINDHNFDATDEDIVSTMLALADGSLLNRRSRCGFEVISAAPESRTTPAPSAPNEKGR